MKKNLKKSVLALALLASATGVFAPNIANAVTNKKLVAVSWQKLDHDGNPEGSPVMGDENNPFADECSGSGSICAQGTIAGQSTPTLEVRYN